MSLYKISYLNIIKGSREAYMNTGFTSEESAQKELDILLRNYEKQKDLYTEEVIQRCLEKGVRIPIHIIGRDWKIEPWKLKKP